MSLIPILQHPAFRHLRLPFSWFLLPAFLMGWVSVPEADPIRALALGLILHVLVYPSSNAFNSWQDRDEGPIGGLEHPPAAPASLRWWSLLFDVLAVGIGSWLWVPLGLGLAVYILASRAYSWRPIRLKKYPWPGFFIVVFFQGPWVMLLAAAYLPAEPFLLKQLLAPGAWYLASALVLAGTYPLTQVYQHAADKADGVTSLSAWLGVNGTFRFSAAAFALAGPFLLTPLWLAGRTEAFWLLFLAMIPALGWFFYWWQQVARQPAAANFKNTMTMNLLAATALNLALGLVGGLSF